MLGGYDSYVTENPVVGSILYPKGRTHADLTFYDCNGPTAVFRFACNVGIRVPKSLLKAVVSLFIVLTTAKGDHAMVRNRSR